MGVNFSIDTHRYITTAASTFGTDLPQCTGKYVARQRNKNIFFYSKFFKQLISLYINVYVIQSLKHYDINLISCFVAYFPANTAKSFSIFYLVDVSERSAYTSYVDGVLPAASRRLKQDGRVSELCDYRNLAVDVQLRTDLADNPVLARNSEGRLGVGTLLGYVITKMRIHGNFFRFSRELLLQNHA